MARNKYYFNGDDFHPMQPTSADIILRQQLEYSISRYFYEACDRKFKISCLIVGGMSQPTLMF